MLAVMVGGCSRVGAPPPAAPAPPVISGWIEEGIASWYGEPFHGRTTASGETYDMESSTAAHRTLPFGTVVRVENLQSGRSTTLRINDRGPFVRGRTIDVSRRGARELDMLGSGIAPVRVIVIEAPAERDCWEVQAGAFTVPEYAQRLRDSLAAQGQSSSVIEGTDGTFRVRVGPITSLAEAERVASRIDDGFLLGCPVPS